MDKLDNADEETMDETENLRGCKNHHNQKNVKFLNPVVLSTKIIASANKGRKVKKRFIEPYCSSREADEIDDTKDDTCRDRNDSAKYKEKDEDNDIETATQEMVRFLNEFLEEERSEIREINRQCTRVTNILRDHHYAEVEEVNNNLELLLE